MMKKLIADMCRPCLRRLPAGAGRIYRLLGGYRGNEDWCGQGFRLSRGTEHGYGMILDLVDVFERETHYLGRFHEWDVQILMNNVLRSGDTFVDVGANIGMLTLLGAKNVGVRGSVLAFEPNPEARTRLEMHVLMNDLKQVEVFGTALSSQRQKLTLIVPRGHSGIGTLRQGAVGDKRFEVQTSLLDDYLEHIPKTGRVLLKTDAEGYDFQILMGACQLLSRPEVVVVSEVNHEWLNESGSSAEEMFKYMASMGYDPYYVQSVRHLCSRFLTVTPLSLPGPHHWFNAVFCRESDLSVLTNSHHHSKPMA